MSKSEQSPMPLFNKFSNPMMLGMEAATTSPAEALLAQAGLLAPDLVQPAVILDNACGAGLVTSRLFALRQGSVGTIVCGDLAPTMIGAAQARIESNEWTGVEAKVIDSRAIPYPDGHFTHVLTNLGTQGTPESDKSVRESLRVLRQGGRMGLTTWARLGWLRFVQTILPDFSMGGTYGDAWTDWETTEGAAAQVTAAGFVNVKATYHDFEATIHGVDVMVQMCSFVLKEKATDEVKATMKANLLKEFPTEETKMPMTAIVVTADKA